MADYRSDLDRFHKLSAKNDQPAPKNVTMDRIIGLALIAGCGSLGILVFVSLFAGVYTENADRLTALGISVVCFLFAFLGYQFRNQTKFYDASRRYLQDPGTVSVRILAANSRYSQADAKKYLKAMIRRKYYTNLSLSKDQEQVIISKVEE